jgi:methyltransferase (TIGR00027 family)
VNADRASKTAMMVAYMRALADAGASHVPGFRDPLARRFLNAKWTRRLTKVEAKLRSGQEGVMVAASRVAADMMALRTATIDAVVKDAVAQNIRQIVILGAGLDTRAWRMPELAGTQVFEVDHPATQAFKQQHLETLPRPVAAVVFVPVDFEHDSLDNALARAGHDPNGATCWIWEGVVMYLTRDAMRTTLRQLAARSANGSILIVNYHTELRRGLVGFVLRLLGEPFKSEWSPTEMAADLSAVGFRVEDDSGVADWAERFATGPVETKAGGGARIAVALR